jgi:hypothetical protein
MGGRGEAFDVIRRGQSGGKRGRGETSAGCVERVGLEATNSNRSRMPVVDAKD